MGTFIITFGWWPKKRKPVTASRFVSFIPSTTVWLSGRRISARGYIDLYERMLQRPFDDLKSEHNVPSSDLLSAA